MVCSTTTIIFWYLLCRTFLMFCIMVCVWSIWLYSVLPPSFRDACSWKWRQKDFNLLQLFRTVKSHKTFTLWWLGCCSLNQKDVRKFATSFVRNLAWNICSVQNSVGFSWFCSLWHHQLMGKCTEWCSFWPRQLGKEVNKQGYASLLADFDC